MYTTGERRDVYRVLWGILREREHLLNSDFCNDLLGTGLT